MRLMLDDIGQYPLLTANEEIELARRAEAGDAEARERLVTSNLRLVVWVAKRYQRDGVALADLVQEGVFGLMRAVDGYDWRRGNRFATYATHWIRQRVQRAAAVQSRTIRLPGHVTEEDRAIRRSESELAVRLGRTPSDVEVATDTQLTVAEVARVREATQSLTSLDAPMGEDGDPLGDIIAIADQNVEEHVAADVSAESLRQMVSALPERAREVLELRYGLDTGQPMTLTEVGARLGLSRERVRQIEQRALQRLSRSETLAGLRLAG